MPDLLPTLLIVGVMTAAAFTDLSSRRIPNKLVLAGLVLGLVTRAMAGLPALGDGLLGAGAGLAIGIFLFAVGALGAGDGKLMAVAGAFLGLEQGLYALGTAAIAGGILALLLAVKRGVILPVLLNTRDLGVWMTSFGRRGERITRERPGAITFPFGVAIAIGSLAVWFGVVQW